jgi:hypothetical protein
MAMHISATLFEATIIELLGQLLPLKVVLDEKKRRWVEVARPDHVKFLVDEGLQFHTSAKVQWSVAGVSIPFLIRRIELMVTPRIVEDELGGKLVFGLEIEDADLKGIPAAIDQSIVAKVNAKLKSIGDKIGWDFGKTLRREFPLPSTLYPVEAFQMRAQEGSVVIKHDRMILSMYTPARFKRAE